ncbi:hypothetical protein [Nonlabens ponticola]|uniref:Uncharacterized protein n=1 Tax=Nonlabens ponticola TaxID=2496866 RepID=A0A3S9MXQ5_9FLAO|nr:hypothetical protein [Nonlabens ponticola]AZQ44056.1 hypothetical protein EJ995_07350 [Nonlabens ponticola]
MAQRTRNPYIGAIIAIIMIGFGSFRFYDYFVNGADIPTWRLLIAGALILYGLFVAYTIISQQNNG